MYRRQEKGGLTMGEMADWLLEQEDYPDEDEMYFYYEEEREQERES